MERGGKRKKEKESRGSNLPGFLRGGEGRGTQKSPPTSLFPILATGKGRKEGGGEKKRKEGGGDVAFIWR